MRYCKRCVTPDTRPRLTFNEEGVCSACQWDDEKKNIHWNIRQNILSDVCDRFRSSTGFDVIVPCSGGKDGSAIAWQLKYKYGMHPLCVTFKPQLQTYIGRQNLENFIASGFDHIMITPESEKYRSYAKDFFIKRGMPKQPFVTGISTAIFQLAAQLNVPFIMYGEEGEREYGGAIDAKQKIDREYLLNYYYEGQDPTEYGPWWKMPSDHDLQKLYPTHWSKFINWDPEDHAKIAKDKCGLQMLVGGSIGTFTNYSQLDDMLQDLHAYMMFIKFGFGRCTSDASIEVRKGRMTREQAVKVVNKLDGQFPLEYLDHYLDYFDMEEREFWQVLKVHVNHELLEITENSEKPWRLREQCA